MPWNDLASNQMVSFTDAQTGGFNLQPGQSNVTSNQCMTKNDALTKYVLDSNAMSSFSNNQLVPKSAWVSGVSYSLFDYMYSGDPCNSIYWAVYQGSDGKYYVNNGNWVLISIISNQWWQYAFDYYLYNVYTSTNGNLTYWTFAGSSCGPF